MTDDAPNEIVHEQDEAVHKRSASSLIFQSIDSASQLAAGLGGLGVGVAAVKGKFGGGGKEPEQPQQPKED